MAILRSPRKRSRRDPEGRMSLVDHLRELRNRFLIAAGAIVLATIPGWMLYTPILNTLTRPVTDVGGKVNFAGITDPFSVQMMVSIWIALIISSPIWLYEIWAFIVPGLTRREKWTALAFILTAVPLFILGTLMGLRTLPAAITILLGFTPSGSDNIIAAETYLTFATRLIIAFGIAFLLPVFLVALNLVHVLPARLLIRGWRWAIILIFILAAVITPTPDPWTMFSMALPMTVLYFAACGVAALIDRRRARREPPSFEDLPDDVASPL